MRKAACFLLVIFVAVPLWAATTQLPDPTIIDSTPAFSGYETTYVFDSNITTDYASAGGGSSTFLTFDFGAPTEIARVDWWDRETSGGGNGNAVCGASDAVHTFDLIFSNDSTFSTVIHTESVTNATYPSGCGTTSTTLGSPVVARYVKWQVTDSANNSTANTGTAQLSFFTDTTADISVTKTDGVTTVNQGGPVSYTVTVTNNGPQAVGSGNGTVHVTDTFPVTLTNVSYTASSGTGATGFTASGNGNINDFVDMPSGSVVTYNVSATVDGNATGTLVNTAFVSIDNSTVTDPNPGNDNSTDTDSITVPGNGVPALDPRMLLLLAVILAVAGASAVSRG